MRKSSVELSYRAYHIWKPDDTLAIRQYATQSSGQQRGKVWLSDTYFFHHRYIKWLETCRCECNTCNHVNDTPYNEFPVPPTAVRRLARRRRLSQYPFNFCSKFDRQVSHQRECGLDHDFIVQCTECTAPRCGPSHDRRQINTALMTISLREFKSTTKPLTVKDGMQSWKELKKKLLSQQLYKAAECNEVHSCDGFQQW